MSKIEPIKNEDDESFWKNLDISKQESLWFSVDFLYRLNIFNKKELDKLHNDNINYVIVSIINQEYKREDNDDKSKITHTVTTLGLSNENFQIKKEKIISIKEIMENYEETLFHIYIESIYSPQEEILRFIKDSKFLEVSNRRKEINLIFLMIKNNIDTDFKHYKSNFWYNSLMLGKLSKAYDEPSENLMLSKNEYINLYFRRENKIFKKFNLAKKIISKNPKYQIALEIIFDYYTKQDNQNIEEFKNFYKENYQELKEFLNNNFIFYSFLFFLRSKQFDMCEELLQNEKEIHTLWDYDNENINQYLLGILYYEKEKYNESLRCLKTTIENINDTELMFGCNIYMLSIYIKLKDDLGIRNTILQICEQVESISMNDYFVFKSELPTKQFFLDQIHYIIENNISNKNKLIPIYLFHKYFEEFRYEEEGGLPLSENEKKEIKKLVIEIKKNTKEELFDLYILSQGYYNINKYNDALLYKLKYIISGGDEWTPVNIKKCNDDFLYNYGNYIKKEIKEIPVRMERYFKKMFSDDIEELFDKKYHKTISDIYLLFDKSTLDLFFHPEELEDEYAFSDKRFEVAYSLNEIGNIDEAEKIYKSIKDQGSSVLNNLALIYEKKGNIKEAKKLIEEAFKIKDGDNSLIKKNKERIFSEKKDKIHKNEVSDKIQKQKLKWSDIEIKFTDDNNIEIYIKGKINKKGDYEIFGFRKPSDISWEILKTLSVINTKVTERNPEFYLTPENFFDKDPFKRSTNKKNLFQTYKSNLSKALIKYFKIEDDDPIPFDKVLKKYKPKLKITPEKSLRELDIPIIKKTPDLLNFD